MAVSAQRRRLALAAVAVGALLACLPAAPAAALSERASLQASFSPDRLGASTTISFGFRLATETGLAPPPLTGLDLEMPAGINFISTTLGTAICQPAALQAGGVEGCPPDSRLGTGSAFVEVPFGVGAGHELPEVSALMGPPHDGNDVVLFYTNGESPIVAQLVFSAELLPASGAFGSQLAAQVPLVPSVPGGSDVSLVSVQSTIGPSHLTYYRRSHGRRVAYHPRGVSLPERCPRGGFPFAARFTFQDGSETSASTTVPCPPRPRRR